jgi:large subunit ribosomal protein L10e
VPKRRGSMAYTRSEYVHSKPPPRVTRFTLGDAGLDYEYKITMVAPHSVELSGKSLEAARVTANKVLGIEAGQQFMLKVVAYPHEIIRAHRFMGFAGADRLSQGMRGSFGKATERAAMVKTNQIVLAIYSMQGGVETAKEALTRASKKLPVPCRIEVEALKKADEA